MIEFIEAIRRELIVIILSMAPVSELRGAIPVGISLGLSPIHATLISIVGNIFIVPFLLKLLHPVMEYFEKTVIFNSTIGWVKRRAMKKVGTIKKFSLIGLYLIVALPLPTTGAWTGSIIATLLKLNQRKAFIAISLGIITAGIIVLGLSYGFFSIFQI